MLRHAWLLVVAGCLQEGAVTCEDGTICPQGTACARITALLGERTTLCVTPANFAPCADKAGDDACDPVEGGVGTCFTASEGLVCLPSTCGDGLRDRAEACDDANNVTGDGCAADCMSDETCGNTVIDGIAFEQCDDGNLVDHDGCDSRCLPERPVWTKLELDRMPPRLGSAIAYDAGRGVTLLFGGVDVADSIFYDDTWVWNGTSWSRMAPSTRPSARAGAGMVYDARRGRVVLFGGATSEGTFGDTWEWDGTTWERRATATAPPPREQFGFAYDGRRGRAVLFGGVRTATATLVGAIPTADTWEWDGSVWAQAQPATSPSPRSGGAMAYDPKRGKVVLFGGVGMQGLASTAVWEYDGTTWASLTPPSPPVARQDTAMAWDARSQTVLLFGGVDGNDVLRDDLWSWNGAQWQLRNVSPRPAPRAGHMVVGDPVRGRLIVLGSHLETDNDLPTTTHEWNGTAWTSGTLPDPAGRTYRQVAFDPLRRRAVLVDDDFETWESDGRAWYATTATNTPYGGASTYDPVRRRTVLFGGFDGVDYIDDTLLWDGSTWTIAATPVAPSARNAPAMAFDTSRGYAVMFGGTGLTALDDTWLWDANGWRAATPAHVPPARDQHAMGYDPVRREIVMFGGEAVGTPLNDTWVWTGTDWEDRSGVFAQRPPARSGAAIAYDGARRRLVMFAGGESITATHQDAWEWEGTRWVPVQTDANPIHRTQAGLFPAASGAGLVAIGGYGAAFQSRADDQWLLRWEGVHTDQACVAATDDQDLDGLVGCADLDCWAVCTPMCTPGATCDPAGPRCGDGMCGAFETCRACPADCGACTPSCGDGACDPGETCPGDCP